VLQDIDVERLEVVEAAEGDSAEAFVDDGDSGEAVDSLQLQVDDKLEVVAAVEDESVEAFVDDGDSCEEVDGLQR
jgi:hypothetical protein